MTTHHAQLTKLVHADVPGVGSAEQHPPAKGHSDFLKLRQSLKFLLAEFVKLFARPHESEQNVKMAVCACYATDTGNAVLDKTACE